VLGGGHHRQAHMGRRMSSAGGWRVTAGTRLQVADLDPARLLGRVSKGPGGNDRVVPLAPRGLAWWRAYGQIARPRPWVFPARHRPTPRSPTPLQPTVNVGGRQRGLAKAAARPTRRPADAPQLVARGGPRPTARSPQLTPKAGAGVPAASTARLADREALWRSSCQRWRTGGGGTAARTWTRVAKRGGPAPVGRSRTSSPAARRPSGGPWTQVTPGAESPRSPPPAALAAGPRATTTRPKPGWKSGGRSSSRWPTVMPSFPCPKRGGPSSAATRKLATTSGSGPRRTRASRWPRTRLLSGG
jgi:hypothetical protein